MQWNLYKNKLLQDFTEGDISIKSWNNIIFSFQHSKDHLETQTNNCNAFFFFQLHARIGLSKGYALYNWAMLFYGEVQSSNWIPRYEMRWAMTCREINKLYVIKIDTRICRYNIK